MNVIFLLCDTMTRDKIGPYHHGTGRYGHIRTPNLDRLAQRCVTFDNHWINSSPCMPARRDLFSGRIEFPWRSWGPRESFDPDWSLMCRQAHIYSALFTDHANLFDAGGENYHLWFTEYQFTRGHFNDACRTALPLSDRLGQQRKQIYENGRRQWRDEQDTFVARTLRGAADWLDRAGREAAPFFMMIDEFDPHWPLDPPEPYRSMYLDDPSLVEKNLTTFYNKGGNASKYSHDELAWLNAQCAGKFTMVDRWIGELLDAMDRNRLWDDTMLIVTSDHGEFIGEYGQVSKGSGFCYPLFSRIPLLIHHPRAKPGHRCAALTCTVDLHATVLDALGLPVNQHAHGRSVLPLLTGDTDAIRQDVLYGWWGKGFYWTDGHALLCKAPEAKGPLYQYGTNLGEKCTGLAGKHFDRYAGANVEVGAFLPHTDRPVYRIPSDGMAYAGAGTDFDALFDLDTDPQCTTNLWNTDLARRNEAIARLASAMQALNVPDEHFVRLGMPSYAARSPE